MSFKYPTRLLARWLEELSQFNMVILHRKGIDHGNADALSRIPDPLEYCNLFSSVKALEDLPCFPECQFCARAHHQWARFTEDVDDVIPLSAWEVSMYPTKSVRLLLGRSDKDGFIRPLLGDEDIVQHELCQDDGLPFLSARPLVPSLGNVDDSGVHL